MKHIYNTLLGLMVFYFISKIFGGVMDFSDWNGFDGIFLSGLLFGVVVAILPAVLGFFKIKENNGALLLGGIVVNFFYYFLGYYLFKLFTVTDSGKVRFFHDSLILTLDDKVIILILISLISSVVIVSFQSMAKKLR